LIRQISEVCGEDGGGEKYTRQSHTLRDHANGGQAEPDV
jgi:hypothetical protein